MIDNVKKSAIKGSIWNIIFLLLGVPLSYVVSVLLGNISPAALGIYTVILMFFQAVNTFVLFGGNNVLSNFLPKIERKVDTLFSYLVLIIFFTLVFIILIAFNPDILLSITQQAIPQQILKYLLILTPIYVATDFIIYALNGNMNIKESAICNKLQLLVLFTILMFSYAFFRDFLIKSYIMIILLSFLISRMFIMLYGIKVLRELFIDIKFKLYFPPGFWKFSLSIHFATIMTFFYENIDRLIILKSTDVKMLGIYVAYYYMWNTLKFIPQSLANVLVPTISSYMYNNQTELIKKTCVFVQRYSTIFTVSVGLFLLTFVNEIMMLFGPEYSKYSIILSMFVFASSVSTLNFVNIPLLIAAEKNFIRTLNSVLVLVLQFILCFYFQKKYGIIGIALGVMVVQIIGQVLPNYFIIKKSKFGLTIPYEYVLGIVVTLICSLLFYYYKLAILERIIILLIMNFIYLKLCKFKIAEINSLYKKFKQ